MRWIRMAYAVQLLCCGRIGEVEPGARRPEPEARRWWPVAGVGRTSAAEFC
ncbi:predicted protein [Plenodomus lingam JN3]|uniref:Predicted protein n=1 Tax=Leptosphaeria maculans (strain JN3 / isolate v23.1.3 / race Av1-4-5-6-7-8) TaxID=985895 RepID=E4ZLR8_LEPMJ|nr:predicted protein [Plenodomus lingam JN3]CBX92748.1 predicted protein [Plenodomus lingam JN3]